MGIREESGFVGAAVQDHSAVSPALSLVLCWVFCVCLCIGRGQAQAVCSAITPVPGGVGPMTIAMLLKNTINLARHSKGLAALP